MSGPPNGAGHVEAPDHEEPMDDHDEGSLHKHLRRLGDRMDKRITALERRQGERFTAIETREGDRDELLARIDERTKMLKEHAERKTLPVILGGMVEAACGGVRDVFLAMNDSGKVVFTRLFDVKVLVGLALLVAAWSGAEIVYGDLSIGPAVDEAVEALVGEDGSSELGGAGDDAGVGFEP